MFQSIFLPPNSHCLVSVTGTGSLVWGLMAGLRVHVFPAMGAVPYLGAGSHWTSQAPNLHLAMQLLIVCIDGGFIQC